MRSPPSKWQRQIAQPFGTYRYWHSDETGMPGTGTQTNVLDSSTQDSPTRHISSSELPSLLPRSISSPIMASGITPFPTQMSCSWSRSSSHPAAKLEPERPSAQCSPTSVSTVGDWDGSSLKISCVLRRSTVSASSLLRMSSLSRV